MTTQTGSCRQITGTSDVSVDDAIARALSVAQQSYGEPEWFDVITARGFISNGRVTHYQVTLDLGYADAAGAHAAPGNDFYFRRACTGGSRLGTPHTIETRL